jgi:hypothetical protein
MATTNNANYASAEQPIPTPGPFLARVISHQDPTYMGMLEVELLRPVGNSSSEGQLHSVKMMTPFYGVTGVNQVGKDPDDYNNTQKSYGMWFVPPDPGTTVIVVFIDGDPKRGYWMGCVMDESMNFMLPGLAATEQVVEGSDADQSSRPGRAPVAEYNKIINSVVSDTTKIKKPIHPLAASLKEQGLLVDDVRGITTSSSRRETPSAVFGISTPGPIDKQSGAKTGTIGRSEYEIKNAFVSRLGGSTFVMDDGDDKFLRKTPASEGPPLYAAVEQGELDGDVTLPNNELIRLRTRTGHQILLHNSEDLIYIGNARGTTWIELSSDGKIDIFAEDSVSVHTKNDLNFYADRDINMEAGRNINIKAANNYQTEIGNNAVLIVGVNNTIQVKGEYSLKTSLDNKFTSGGTTHINSVASHLETAANIHMNGPVAALAMPVTPLPTFENPVDLTTTVTSILKRMPQHEPWPHHENLDPVNFKPEITDREVAGDIAVPDAWNNYTTNTDTFNKVKGAE